jgi:hypothetical protein
MIRQWYALGDNMSHRGWFHSGHPMRQREGGWVVCDGVHCCQGSAERAVTFSSFTCFVYDINFIIMSFGVNVSKL